MFEGTFSRVVAHIYLKQPLENAILINLLYRLSQKLILFKCRKNLASGHYFKPSHLFQYILKITILSCLCLKNDFFSDLHVALNILTVSFCIEYTDSFKMNLSL